MFIELAEFLRCPSDHHAAHCVVTADRMLGRHIVEGTVGCPVCRREFPIADGVATLAGPGAPAATPPPVAALPDPADVAAVLNLSGPGGYVVLVGSAAGLAGGLLRVIEGIHVVAVDAPADAPFDAQVSRLDGRGRLPLRDSMARGVVLGSECGDGLTAEAVRVVLRGLRVVRLGERMLPEAVRTLAVGRGMAVGEKA